jgi:hypothetical protein
MSTHYEITVTVEGSPTDVDQFVADSRKVDEQGQVAPLVFSHAVPENIKPGSDAQKWRKKNWGTTSEPEFKSGSSWVATENGKSLNFRIADSIPGTWLLKASKKYPSLNFSMKFTGSEKGTQGLKKAKRGWPVHNNSESDQYSGVGLVYFMVGVVFILTMDPPTMGFTFLVLGMTFFIIGQKETKKPRTIVKSK